MPSKFESALSSLVLDDASLVAIQEDIKGEMLLGLAKSNQMLRCLRTFISKLPAGDEVGTYLVVDLGGSNLRVGRIQLDGHGSCTISRKKWEIPDKVKDSGGSEIFEFVAQCISDYLEGEPDARTLLEAPVGFTFSYPVRQLSLNHGTLLQWNKAIKADSLIGRDVVQLLEQELKKLGLPLKIAALMNDTVATLAAHAYKYPKTKIGVILGTGTNAAFVAPMSKITKQLGVPGGAETAMVINSEWGAYGESTRSQQLLKLSPYDKGIDRESNNPGKQIFEKMISGMYLGEIARLAIADIFASVPIAWSPFELTTKDLSDILSDQVESLAGVEHLLSSRWAWSTTAEDRKAIVEVCKSVCFRSASLCAAGICAIHDILGLGDNDECIVAVDGSLYEYSPGYAGHLDRRVKFLKPHSRIVIKLAKGQSLAGAATVVATLCK